ncbi:MAG: hypothetical protein M3145_03985 [Pseudomonadota bacterium]|nr:hypothetical protein [Pseudomonadota bacterium]
MPDHRDCLAGHQALRTASVDALKAAAVRRSRFCLAGLLIVGLLGAPAALAQSPGTPGDDMPVRMVPTVTIPGACMEPQCAARSELEKGSLACTRLIDDLAADPEFDWALRRQGGLFDRHEWTETSGRVVRYQGDRLRFQASLGSWTRLVYECDYDLGDERVVGVRAQKGQFRRSDREATGDALGRPTDAARRDRATATGADDRPGGESATVPASVTFRPVRDSAAGAERHAARAAPVRPAADKRARTSHDRVTKAKQARAAGKQLRDVTTKRARAEAASKPSRTATLKRARAEMPAKPGRAAKPQSKRPKSHGG